MRHLSGCLKNIVSSMNNSSCIFILRVQQEKRSPTVVSFLVSFLLLLRTNNTHVRHSAPTELELTGRMRFCLQNAVVLDLASEPVSVSLGSRRAGEADKKTRQSHSGFFGGALVIIFYPSIFARSSADMLFECLRKIECILITANFSNYVDLKIGLLK